MIGSRRRALASLVAAMVAPSVFAQATRAPVAASTPARDAALQALANRLQLPLVDEAVAIFSTQLRRTLPTYFVDTVGENVNLGPQWKRGNRYFDQAVQQLDAALGAEEARGGPLLKLSRGDLLLAVNIPWNQADIAFVDETLGTDLGHEAERAIDAKAAQQTIATLKRRIAIGAAGRGVASAFADLDARAQSQFGDASLMLLASKASDPQRTTRLQRLLEQVTVAPSDAIGERIVDRLSQRLLDAAAGQLPNLLTTIAGFRTGS